jgi:hypothetical protein
MELVTFSHILVHLNGCIDNFDPHLVPSVLKIVDIEEKKTQQPVCIGNQSNASPWKKEKDPEQPHLKKRVTSNQRIREKGGGKATRRVGRERGNAKQSVDSRVRSSTRRRLQRCSTGQDLLRWHGQSGWSALPRKKNRLVTTASDEWTMAGDESKIGDWSGISYFLSFYLWKWIFSALELWV